MQNEYRLCLPERMYEVFRHYLDLFYLYPTGFEAVYDLLGLVVEHVVEERVEAVVGAGQGPQELLDPQVHSQGPRSVCIVPAHNYCQRLGPLLGHLRTLRQLGTIYLSIRPHVCISTCLPVALPSILYLSPYL